MHARGFSLAGRLVTASEFVENTIEKEMAKFERQGRSSAKKRPRRVRGKVRNRLGIHLFALVFPVEQMRLRNSCRVIMVNNS